MKEFKIFVHLEKVSYRQIFEIYVTSINYNLTADNSIQFFKRAQNKIHYSIHSETIAEVTCYRYAEKESMGLTTIAGNQTNTMGSKNCKKLSLWKSAKCNGISLFCRKTCIAWISHDNGRLGQTPR